MLGNHRTSDVQFLSHWWGNKPWGGEFVNSDEPRNTLHKQKGGKGGEILSFDFFWCRRIGEIGLMGGNLRWKFRLPWRQISSPVVKLRKRCYLYVSVRELFGIFG